MNKVKNFKLTKLQSGAILILMTFILSLIITGVLIKFINSTSNQFQQQEKINEDLGNAKEALLAWAVSNSVNFGQLPYPDRNGGGGYDGFSDCPPSKTPFKEPESYALLLGKLPIFGQTSPCVGRLTGLGLGANEFSEKRFWYAVSRNVVHAYELLSTDSQSNPIINPNIIEHPTYNWMKVLDKNGNIISDRVAAVIIAPGSAVGNQSRSNTANASQFLDRFQKNKITYANDDYDNADEDFVMGEELKRLDVNDASISKPYYFNDYLVFITIDELMAAIQNRVAEESKWLLRAYKAKNGTYPNAADLTKMTLTSNLYSSGTHTSGLLPIDITDNCQCTDEKSCSCGFGKIESVTMFRQSGTWNSAEDFGNCKSTLKASGKECVCNGAGSCSRTFSTSSTIFSCQSDGTCTNNLTTETNNKFIYALPNYADFYSATDNCSIKNNTVECNNSGNFNIGLNEAKWFKQNLWQQFLYYTFSNSNDIQTLTNSNISALLIAIGEPITTELGNTQTRPSDDIHDYLDSAENTDLDTIFESNFKTTTKFYNDKIFIISP